MINANTIEKIKYANIDTLLFMSKLYFYLFSCGKIIFFINWKFCAFILIIMTAIPMINANTIEKLNTPTLTPSYLCRNFISIYFQ